MSKKKKTELSVESPYLDVIGAAMYLKLAKSTIYKLIHNHKSLRFPVRHFGRKPMFVVEELKQWMEHRLT